MPSRQFKIILCILSALAVFVSTFAVETIIVGEIVNETTGEPIPNVNIHFRGTKIGTTSDESGAYALRVDMQAKAQLVFSAVGFFTQRYDIEPGTMAGLQVAMREKTATLTEVVVAPNENPALELLRKVRAHSEENDRSKHTDLSSTVVREQTLYVSHINKRHLRRALWRSLQSGMMAQEDSTFILPLYRETQSFRLSGSDMIPANDQQTQALILTETEYASLLGNEGNLNFYQHSVPLMGHAFLSPLAANGNLYYRYYLEDDTVIHFRTRNPFYATFNGQMVIDTTTYALHAIQAYVPAEVAVNYVNTLHVSQTLLPDGSIADEHISALLDVSIKSEQAGTVFPTLLLTTNLRNNETAVYRDHEITGSQDHEFTSLTQTDSAFAALDSIPLMRAARWFATIATTGYIPTGSFLDIGHIEEILQVNHHEGVHVGLPFRTNEKLSEIVSLEASVGYGVKDRLPKGMGRISVNIPAERRHILQLEYNDRYVWSEVDDFDRLLRENSMGWGNFDFTAYAFEALHRDSLCVNTALRQRQAQFHWFADWSPNVETHTYIRAGWQPAALGKQTFDINYQSLSLIARLSWGERKYDGYFLRRYAYSSKYPVLYLGLEAGHWSTNSQKLTANSHLYTHIRLLLTQHAQLGIGGTLTYALQAGALFGRVPNTLLWQADANQGYAYDPYRFTFLHGGQMMADKYVTLQAEWNGHGILFNMIPGIRWLHLRELVEAKIAYGYLSKSVSTPSTLYAEIGIGIGNILRVADLYSIWSLSPDIRWAMRFRIHLGL